MELKTAFYEDVLDDEISISQDMGSINHAKIQSRMAKVLGNAYDDEYEILTELSLDLSSGGAKPDLAIYPIIEDDWYHDTVKEKEPPLLVIEILSPLQHLSDVTNKIDDIYFAAGVKSAWVVIPTFETIHVISPSKKITTFTQGRVHDAATGIEMDMDAVFKKRMRKI